MLVLRLSLPISWASLARWFNSSTRRRSSSSICLRQSAISIKFPVSLWTANRNPGLQLSRRIRCFAAALSKRTDQFCYSFSPTARNLLDRSYICAAAYGGLGEFVYLPKLLLLRSSKTHADRKFRSFEDYL